MYIVYGKKSSVSSNGELITDHCPECGKNNFAHVYRNNYMHVFWIPMFAIGRESVLVCTNCQKVIEGRELSEKMRVDIRDRKEKPRYPYHHFFGVIALLVVGAIFSVMGFAAAQGDKKLIAAPVIGDYYVIDNASIKEKLIAGGVKKEALDDIESGYCVTRIDRIDGETCTLAVGNAYYSSYSRAGRDISKDEVRTDKEYFTDIHLPYSREELVALYRSGSIKDVERK
jgi:hypothetical protein